MMCLLQPRAVGAPTWWRGCRLLGLGVVWGGVDGVGPPALTWLGRTAGMAQLEGFWEHPGVRLRPEVLPEDVGGEGWAGEQGPGCEGSPSRLRKMWPWPSGRRSRQCFLRREASYGHWGSASKLLRWFQRPVAPRQPALRQVHDGACPGHGWPRSPGQASSPCWHSGST